MCVASASSLSQAPPLLGPCGAPDSRRAEEVQRKFSGVQGEACEAAGPGGGLLPLDAWPQAAVRGGVHYRAAGRIVSLVSASARPPVADRHSPGADHGSSWPTTLQGRLTTRHGSRVGHGTRALTKLTGLTTFPGGASMELQGSGQPSEQSVSPVNGFPSCVVPASVAMTVGRVVLDNGNLLPAARTAATGLPAGGR